MADVYKRGDFIRGGAFPADPLAVRRSGPRPITSRDQIKSGAYMVGGPVRRATPDVDIIETENEFLQQQIEQTATITKQVNDLLVKIRAVKGQRRG